MKNRLLSFFVFLTAAIHATEPTVSTVVAYPVSICVVSGDKLGQMGPPVIVNYKGTEVRFCCKDCVKDFEKDPEKYLKRLHDAEQKTK